MNIVRQVAKGLARNAGFDIVKLSLANQARKLSPALKLYSELELYKQELIAPHLPYSRSQLGQDLFVLSEALGGDYANYYVEFGATDGIRLSNTHLLEKRLDWDGLLAEPAKVWHEQLYANRSCHIDTRCVDAYTGQIVSFAEVIDDGVGYPELSKIQTSMPRHKDLWLKHNVYDVMTVSLTDLLRDCNAPFKMAYLSIDTEGSELQILEAFDFETYSFKVITVEHNYDTDKRQKLHSLLSRNGYKRKFEELSLWDDWYVYCD
jgi:hypothetical protein